MYVEYLPPADGPQPEAVHLRDYWHAFLRRRWLAFAVFSLVVAAVVARVVLVPPLYEATSKILIEREAPDVLAFDKNARVNDAWEDYYQTQHRLLQSRLLARKVVERLRLLADPEFGGPGSKEAVDAAHAAGPGASPLMERGIDLFLGRLRVQPVKNTQLVAVTFRAARPELAAQVANALAEVYIQQTLDFRYRISAEAGAWLDHETREHMSKLESAEVALQQFQKAEGLSNVEEQRTLNEQKLKDLGSSLTAARTRRLDHEALYRQMSGAGNVEELPDVIRSPVIQSLRSELAALDQQRIQLSARYLDEHPQMAKLHQQIEEKRQKIAFEARRIVRAAESDYRVAAAQEASVSGALEGAKREALDLSRRSVKYDALKRDLEASHRLAESLLTRQKQTDVVREIKASNVHVIDPAITPQSPVRPQPIRDIALGVLLGFGCAIAAAFARDYFDGSVGKPSDVKMLGLSLLGVIPERTAREAPLVVSAGRGREPFAEGYRVLRTALRPGMARGRSQVLLVTSALPGEGKSVTTANLGFTLASTEEQVLLIDADLRRPSLHSLLRVRRAPGLSEVLTGVTPLEEAIQPVPGSRLSVLPCGTPISCSPSDLLASDALPELLATLRGRYQRILVDTPPVGAIADTLVLSPLVDGVLVVARSGKVSRSALAHVLERLANAKGRVLGVVLNRARPDRDYYDYGPAFAGEPQGEGRRRGRRVSRHDAPHSIGRLH